MKLLRSSDGMNTGTPPAMRTISGYDTQQGVGISTSSPGSRMHWKMVYRLCFAPEETIMSDGV